MIKRPEPAAAAEEGPGRSPMILWDDDAFRARVSEVATRRGISARQAAIKAGTSAKFMEPAPGGRNANIVMRLARFLNVHPAYLMFGPTIATDADATMSLSTIAGISKEINGGTPQERLVLIQMLLATHALGSIFDPAGNPEASVRTLRQIELLARSSLGA